MSDPFCGIVAGVGPAALVHDDWPDAVAFLPMADKQGRRGCTEGHILVVPRLHVADAAENAVITGQVAARAAELAAARYTDFHLIVNCGPNAGQTVSHLHWHIVPRRPGDGLVMPWTAQQQGFRHE